MDLIVSITTSNFTFALLDTGLAYKSDISLVDSKIKEYISYSSSNNNSRSNSRAGHLNRSGSPSNHSGEDAITRWLRRRYMDYTPPANNRNASGVPANLQNMTSAV